MPRSRPVYCTTDAHTRVMRAVLRKYDAPWSHATPIPADVSVQVLVTTHIAARAAADGEAFPTPTAAIIAEVVAELRAGS